MAFIKEPPNPFVGEGILHPLQRHQFVVQYNLGFTEKGGKLLTQQTVDFLINEKDDEFTVHIEQPSSYATEFFILISDLAKPNALSTISLCQTVGDSCNPTEIIRFGSCECIHHELKMTYFGHSDIATHELKFKYNRELLPSILD